MVRETDEDQVGLCEGLGGHRNEKATGFFRDLPPLTCHVRCKSRSWRDSSLAFLTDFLLFSLGSSPRLRGTPYVDQNEAQLTRFIPAPAGKTAPVSDRDCRSPVHPRACGEHSRSSAHCSTVSGSSPRLRGTHLLRRCRRSASRFIPTPAGNTKAPYSGAVVTTVHPRACGEHTSREIRSPALFTVHPRACGEHVPVMVLVLLPVGSSPRLRGTRRRLALHPGPQRFIPAPAGNTRSYNGSDYNKAVHPRACGEHQDDPVQFVVDCGSSPRLRGTLAQVRREPERDRFIPAPAGNT